MADDFEVARAAGVTYSLSDRPPLAASPIQIPRGQREAYPIASGQSATEIESKQWLNFLWLDDASQEWIDAVGKLPDLERLLIQEHRLPTCGRWGISVS